MRLPNGYGTVYNLGGKRRNPFVAKKTVGWKIVDGKERQTYITIGYFPDRKTALQELAKYNENPYDVNSAKLTFSEIYEKWYDECYPNETEIGKKQKMRNYIMAYNKCQTLYDMPINSVKAHHIQQVIDSAKGSYESTKRIKHLCSKMFEYCIKYEFLTKNYATDVVITTKKKTAVKEPFSIKEVNLLWDKTNENIYIKFVLILIYSGCRIGELLNLNKEDVDLKQQCFTIKASKTESGIRIVPIHNKVLSFWKEFYKLSTEEAMFVGYNKKRLDYSNFLKKYWNPLIKEQLNMNHTIHETRHTFITRSVVQGLNKTIIKKIVGHKSQMDLTERVYTHIDIEEMKNEMNKISWEA